MAAIPGVRVTDTIVPTDTTDTYGTHNAFYGVGGWRTVNAATERDAIPNARRQQGMIVVLLTDSSIWKLGPTPWTGTPADWSNVAFGGGSGSVTNTPLTDATPVVVDAALVDELGSITWTLALWNTDGRREKWVVEADHDGIPSADATDASYDVVGKGPGHGNILVVDVSGAGLTQVMRLVITANGTGWTAAWIRSFTAIAGAT